MAGTHKFKFSLALIVLWGIITEAAPRPKPVEVFGGYSSVSKSVTFTKRMEFQMNKDQSLKEPNNENQSAINSIKTNDTTKEQKKTPQVNHSVQFSIGTNIESDEEGQMDPPLVMESIANDIQKIEKMAKIGMKMAEAIPSSTLSPRIVLQGTTKGVEIPLSLESYDDALYEDVAPEDAGSLDNREKIPLSEISLTESSLLEDPRTDLIDNQSHASISSMNVEKEIASDSDIDLNVYLENKFVTRTYPEDTTIVNAYNLNMQSTENYDESSLNKEGEIGIVKTDDSFIESSSSPTLREEMNLTDVLNDHELSTTQPLPSPVETEVLSMIKDDHQSKDQLIETENIDDQSIHVNEFESGISDLLDKKGDNGQRINLQHFTSADRTHGNFENNNTDDQLQAYHFESSSKAPYTITEEYDDIVELDNSSVPPIDLDTGYDFGTTILGYSVTKSLLSDTVDKVITEGQVDATFRAPEVEKMQSSTTEAQLDLRDTTNEVESTTVKSENLLNPDVAVTTFSTPTRSAELSEDKVIELSLTTTPVSSQIVLNEDKDLEFMHPIGTFVNYSDLEDSFPRDQPPVSEPSSGGKIVETQGENEFNYASYYPTDYDYVDDDETTDRITTASDVRSSYEYTDLVATTDVPVTSSDLVTDEIAHASRLGPDTIQEPKFLTSTIPSELLTPESSKPNETINHRIEGTTLSQLESQKLGSINFSNEKMLKESVAEDDIQNQDLNYDYGDLRIFELTRLDEVSENESLSTPAPTTDKESIDTTDLPIGASIEIGDLGSDYITENVSVVSDTVQTKNSQAKNENNVQFVPTQRPSIDIPALNSNIDLSKIDFSHLDFPGLEDPGALTATGNDRSVSPPNLESLDLSGLISDLGLGNLDLSQIPPDFDVGNVDISHANFENIPPSELVNNLGLFQLPNSSLNDTVQSNSNLANLYSNLNFAEGIAPHVHPLSQFNLANTETRIPDLHDHPVDLSRVNLNIDRIPKLPVGFRQPHRANEQYAHVGRLQPPPAAPYFGMHGTGDQFLVLENVDGRNFGALSAVNLQRPGDVIGSNGPVRSSHFASVLPDQSNVDHRSDQEFSSDGVFQTHSRYPEPNTVNFFHPLHMVDPNSFHSSDNANVHQIQEDNNRDDLRQPYHGEEIGAKITGKNRTADPADGINLTNLTQLSPLSNGPDLSEFDLTQIPTNFDLSNIDLASIPSNFSIEGLDIDKIMSSIDLSKLDLSKINITELDIPKIMEQLSSSSLDTTLFGQSLFNREAEEIFQNEASRNFKRNTDEKSLPVPEPGVVGSVEKSKWITENETDQQILDELGISHFLTMANSISLDGGASSNFLLCTLCKTGVLTGRKLMTDLAKTDREILSLVIYMCIEFKVFPKDVCRGMINSVGYEVLHVLRTTQHNPEIFCSMLLAGTCEEIPLPTWNINTPRRATVPVEPSTHPDHGEFLILQISDLHTDPEYVAGADTECRYPLCCRNWDVREERGYRRDDGTPERPMESFVASVMANADDPNTDLTPKLSAVTKFPKHAGRWGAFGHCDLPLRSLDRILQAGADLQPDLVYITGDLPPHDVWIQTKESVQRINGLTAERIRSAFPDTPVVMTIGNHETDPINSFPVPEVYDQGFNPSWLYESLATQWKPWVPSSSMHTLIKGGYYAVVPYPGLRVLSVNGNYCNSMNWWLMIAHKDPTEQLAWMDSQLAEADAAGEKVHILTHIPPGYYECLPSWSREFARIVTKYSDVVTGIFSGHQHLDQWEVIYDSENSTRPTSVVYIAPSATTFREHSPSFRTFTVDGGEGSESSWTVVDHHTYTANLTIANLPDNILEFELRYKAREEFNMSDLSPQSWSDLVEVMAQNQTMFNKHMRFKHNYWAEPTEINDCDRECKTKSLCFLVTGDSSNKEPCERLKKIIT
ncbi:Calcineurin-like phosphoesterase domain ApaH type [Trinorchestia longiramus]|nr:Calcineurin-like phosphoesterase domain ApaH type [Trinorchestia longiramus]